MKRAILFCMLFLPLGAATNAAPPALVPASAAAADDITVLTAGDFKRFQARTLADILRHVPGVRVRQHSGFGGRATVYLSGMATGGVSVYRDGVLLNQDSSIDGGCDIAHITLDGIERVEIIRGAQTVRFPNATAGVINLVSRRGAGGQAASLSLMGGYPDTFNGAFTATAGDDSGYFSMTAAQFASRGASRALVPAQNGIESDAVSRSIVSLALGANPVSDLRFSANIYYHNVDLSLDDRAYEDDPNRTLSDKLITADLRYSQSLAPWWKHAVILDVAMNDGHEVDKEDAADLGESLSSRSRTIMLNAKWENLFAMGDFNKLTVGAEYYMAMFMNEYDAQSFEGVTSNDTRGAMRIIAAPYVKDTAVFFKTLTIDAGVRFSYDFDTLSAGAFDYRIAASYVLAAIHSTIHASYSHATRYPYGMQRVLAAEYHSLQPETLEHSIEAGVRQRLFGVLTMDAYARFDTITNAVMFSVSDGLYTNAPGASVLSATAAVAFAPNSRFSASMSYTYAQANYLVTGSFIPEIPRHSARADVVFEPIEKLLVSAGLHYIGPRDAIQSSEAGNSFVVLLDYGLVDVGVSYTWETFDFFVKVENVLSLIPALRPAVDVAGYYGYPFLVTAGASVRL